MNKVLIVSKDQRIPYIPEDVKYDFWSLKEFYEVAGSEEGLTTPYSEIFFNIDSLPEELYRQLKESELADIITYYSWVDVNVELPFYIEEGVKKYQYEEEEDEEEEEINDKQSTLLHGPTPSDEENVEQPNSTEEKINENVLGGIDVIVDPIVETNTNQLNTSHLEALISNKYEQEEVNPSGKGKLKSAKVILFGSSKGGTGKSTTCLITARRYAQAHPDKRVALADFDIIDGQVGISLLKPSPTLKDYYKQYVYGNIGFEYLRNCSIRSEHFSPNLDFYLAPSIDIPEVTNNTDFFFFFYELLLTNYDVVFFDSGIDYLGKEPISRLYKYANRIILTCTTSINSVNSVVKQIQRLKGQNNNVFKPADNIAEKLHVVLTRVAPNSSTNDIVIQTITKEEVPIIAAFGNLDDLINRSQWWQQWEVWDKDERIISYLDKIANFDD